MKEFAHLKFDPEKHKYTSDKGEYTSVTSVIDKYKRPFDSQKMSARVAKRDGLPQEEVLQLWDINRDYSAVRGTEFHLYAETMINEGREIRTQTGINLEKKSFVNFWHKASEKLEVVKTELRVCDDEWMIAGTVDLLVKVIPARGSVFDLSGDLQYAILDWKTSKQVRDKRSYGKMKDPLGHLDDVPLNHYSLQMSLYRAILERNCGFEFSSQKIVHFPRRGGWDLIDCEYMRDEIEEIAKL